MALGDAGTFKAGYENGFFRASRGLFTEDRNLKINMPLMHNKQGKKRKARKKNSHEKELENLYFNFNSPAAYAGAYLLQVAARKRGHDPLKVMDWLDC